MIAFEQSLREENTRRPIDRSGAGFENLGRQCLCGHSAHAGLIPLTVLIGESQDLTRFDAQAGTQMMAEFAGEGEFGSVNIG
jgi:hypothetical protein